MHEVWCSSSNGITREVHPTARVDVGAGVVLQSLSNYLTENGCRIPILGKISINESVEYLGIPDFHRTGGPMRDENILPPVLVGETMVPPIITGEFSLGDPT